MEEKLKKISIVAEYLSGGISYRELLAKHGGSLGSLHRWIKQYQDTAGDTLLKESVDSIIDMDLGEQMPSDVKTLQAELRKSRLHNKLLTAVIDIAEEELSAPIRKKYGPRQS
jgi:transposase-like protein